MRAVILAAVVAMLTLACQQRATKRVSDDLIVYPGASDMHSATTGGVERLHYQLRAAYPPKAIVEQIARQLAKRGWRPLRNNFFNRDQLSEYVRGWVEYRSGTPAQGPILFTCRWWSQWVNDDGEVLDYSLSYTSPSEVFENRVVLDVSVIKGNVNTVGDLAGIPRNSTQRLHELPAGTPPNADRASNNSPDGTFVIIADPDA